MKNAPATAPAAVSERDFGAGATVGVLVPLPLGAPYDYRVPADLTVRLGDFVVVPLGPRQVNGVVWAEGHG